MMGSNHRVGIYDEDRGSNRAESTQERFRYTRETFRYDDLVIVDKLDENHIPVYLMVVRVASQAR